MKPDEATVRVWVGLDLLQAHMLKQMLVESGIECFADRDLGVLPTGELGEIALWVAKKDEARARELLTEMEDEMSAELDADSEETSPNQ